MYVVNGYVIAGRLRITTAWRRQRQRPLESAVSLGYGSRQRLQVRPGSTHWAVWRRHRWRARARWQRRCQQRRSIVHGSGHVGSCCGARAVADGPRGGCQWRGQPEGPCSGCRLGRPHRPSVRPALVQPSSYSKPTPPSCSHALCCHTHRTPPPSPCFADSSSPIRVCMDDPCGVCASRIHTHLIHTVSFAQGTDSQHCCN